MSPEQTPTLEFEREKWRDEYELRKREVAVKEREAKVREDEASRWWWSTPLALVAAAVVGAAIGAGGNALVAWLNGQQALVLEETKAEAARILEVIKTGDPDKAAENLKFLLDVDLINDPIRTKLEASLAKRGAGQGPVLPAARSLTPEELNREIERLIPNRRGLSQEALEAVVKAATPEERQQILHRELQRNQAFRLGLPPEAFEEWESAKTPEEKERILARERCLRYPPACPPK
jgi:hypothetical protein